MTTETEAHKIIKSILNLRCRDGATIADIESNVVLKWFALNFSLLILSFRFFYSVKVTTTKWLENHWRTFTII